MMAMMRNPVTLVPASRQQSRRHHLGNQNPIDLSIDTLYLPAMTPRTRSSNGDVDFKVYYSKKVPQQVHFPHRRKTVRRRTTPVRDGSEKRQMVFLPEKMKKKGILQMAEDSDEETEHVKLEEHLEDGGATLSPHADKEQSTATKGDRKGKKRSSDVLQEDDSEALKPAASANKRRKAASGKSNRRSRHVQPDSDEENDRSIKPDRERMLKRQSTMTQLVEGRKPLPGFENPDFKPVKQGPRLSWGRRDKATKDRKQRTLTQMVHGTRPLEIISDEDVEGTLSDIEAQDADSHTYQDAVARRLAQQGLYRNHHNDEAVPTADDESHDKGEAKEDMQSTAKTKDCDEEVVNSQDRPEPVVQSVEDAEDGAGEDSYKPTQFIDAPITRARCTTQQRVTVPATTSDEVLYVPRKAISSRKARFSLLSTPEKRRIREIPSSQSPADSPLSTQVTPQKFHRSPLKKCTGNQMQAPETPSKRKQVTFKMPSNTPMPPPTLRKFESTIQDSEDEYEDDDDGIDEENLPSSGCCIGTDTQAMIDQIDQACADAAEAGSSQEMDDPPVARSLNGSSPELGELQKQSSALQKWFVPGGDPDHCTKSTSIKQELVEDADSRDLTAISVAQSHSSHIQRPIRGETTTLAEDLHSMPPIMQETCPSTPMEIPDDSSDEEDSPQPSIRRIQHPPSTGIQQSADLNCDDEQIQVPRSLSPPHDETQQSHSSKAEQQLQNEWFSYSQYMHDAPCPQSSSMQAAPDAFSYKATPRPHYSAVSHNTHQQRHSGTHVAASQATTVDEVTQRTPRKNRTQHLERAVNGERAWRISVFRFRHRRWWGRRTTTSDGREVG
ncbi:hypothetical protein GMOD_00003665 [Pyrenophora seminiperda CCB06]|uniref:Uncharacterized protein n=1 Tax=Pyrenophora seminiperda CCB06 TaxID=1302712 RepID=A0A3M7MJ83_9PLEO|nr:hypothetical protein GMOD_00003665 [Pyrenophora seminiperda CCB06]